jgi:hypothetical protein
MPNWYSKIAKKPLQQKGARKSKRFAGHFFVSLDFN